MMKVTAAVKGKNGEEKPISAYVTEEIAAWLSEKDEEIVRGFVTAENRAFNIERKETRRHQSLDKSLEGGFDIKDEKTDVEEEIVFKFESERLHSVLKMLAPRQQLLIEQIYFCGFTQAEMAVRAGVGESAIRSRLKKIYIKLKKFLI